VVGRDCGRPTRGRRLVRLGSPSPLRHRQAGWIAAVSQALVALVPVFVLIVGTLALILVGILAVVALVLLFSSRD